MPIHDWQCGSCNSVLADFYQPLLNSPKPDCPKCQAPMERLWTTNRMHRTFEKFEVEYSGQQIEIDSMGKLRAFERYTHDQYRQGFGEPRVFRAFSQDNSNKEVSVFRDLQPNQYIRKNPKISTRRG